MQELPDAHSESLRAGRWVRLLPFTREYQDFLYELAMDDPSLFRWRFPMGIPVVDVFVQAMNLSTSNAVVIVETKSQSPLGFAHLYNWRAQHEVAHFNIAMVRSARYSGIGIEAGYLFLRHCFASFNLRKLYLTVSSWQLPAIKRVIGDLFIEEGRLHEHSYHQGVWHDELILSISRQRLNALRQELGQKSLSEELLPSSAGVGNPALVDVANDSSSSKPDRSAGLLDGKRVRLSAVDPRFFDYLFHLSTNEYVAHRWRFGGGVPSVEGFRQGLDQGVFAHFVTVLQRTQRPFGYVVAYQADISCGHVHIGGVMEPSMHRTGYPMEAFAIFLSYLFANWSFRKAYMEYIEFNEPQFFGKRLGDGVRVEARLSDYSYHDNRWWDRCLVSVGREEFLEAMSKRTS
jgi:RimJ/RimL family protein N-acetyltransferase